MTCFQSSYAVTMVNSLFLILTSMYQNTIISPSILGAESHGRAGAGDVGFRHPVISTAIGGPLEQDYDLVR